MIIVPTEERKKEFKRQKQQDLMDRLDAKEENAAKKAKSGTERPTGRSWTMSMALPASILLNSQTAELRTYLSGQIARAAVIYKVDEIILYDEYCSNHHNDPKKQCLNHMAKILEYLECPQYLRRDLFPIQPDLKYAGLLNPLDCFHHFKYDESDFPFREGIVKFNNSGDSNNGSLVYVGLETDIKIDRSLKQGTRVTVEFEPQELQNNRRKKFIPGKVVAPSEPRTKSGVYWGYAVRLANSLSAVTSECPFKGGYDLKIGTSDKGDNIDEVGPVLPKCFKHCLIVFGGVKGIEAAMDPDVNLQNVEDPRELFNHYLDVCPDQGSKTIRTEEAVLITLASLRPFILNRSNE